MDKFATRFITKEKMPLVIEPLKKNLEFNEFLELISTYNDSLKKNLLKHGALLFRNCPISNENDFSSVIKQFGAGRFVDYIGGDSPRNKIKDGVYTSTEAPPSMKIPLHNELSFVKYYPKHIYFFCETPPQAKGETIIADARKVYNAIDDKVKKRFIDNGLKYVSCYYYKSALMDMVNRFQRSHKSWIDVFETHDKGEVEKKCREHEFDFKWNQNDWLQISQTRPAVMPHSSLNEMVWFNQAHLYDFNPKLLGMWKYIGAKLFYVRKHMKLHEVYFANNSPIPRTDLYHILDVLDANTVYFPWQKGDLLVLDNVLTMHGRATFSGKRRILTAMTGN